MRRLKLSQENDLAEIRINLSSTFTRSELLEFLSLELYERRNQEEKNTATVGQMKDQVKEINYRINSC